MKNQSFHPAIITGLIFLETLLLAGILILSVNQYYPAIGMDYKYFIPRLIDSYLHYRVNGFSIQWYTPSFGGGLPSYPNPQQIQFSLPQLFTELFDPYIAILLSITIFVFIGIGSSYYLFSKIFYFNTFASLLSGILFLANGFYFQHLGVGHLTFITLPLLPLLLIGILRKRQALLNGTLIGLIFATLLHHGSFYLILYFIFACALSISITGFAIPEALRWRSIIKNCIWGFIFTIALGASKLSAVLHFLRFFPRHISDEYLSTNFQALISIPFQLLGSMTFYPLGLITKSTPKSIWDLLMTYTGSELAFWELDISVTPLIWVLLLMGAGFLANGVITGAVRPDRKRFVALVFFLLFLELTIEFSIARGIFYPWVSKLPILNSLHINPRYTVTLIFPMVMLAIIALNSFLSLFSKNIQIQGFLFLAAVGIALAPLYVYFEIPMEKLNRRQFNVEGSREIYKQAKAGETFVVKQVVADLNDARVFDQQASNLNPYEVIFGYGLGKFKHQLVEGSPYLEVNGEYNFNDPTSLVFPEINGSQIFDRISISQGSNLEKFLSRNQPDWNLPIIQLMADMVSILALALTCGILIIYLFKNTRNKETL